jgi:hypothetical protein
VSWAVLQQSTSSSTLPPRRPVPDTVLLPLCRFLSDHGQLVVLGGAAAVDLVCDIANTTTYFRPVPYNFTRSFVPLLDFNAGIEPDTLLHIVC